MNKKVLTSIFISVTLVWFLLYQIEFALIFETFKTVPLHLVVIGFVFYAISYLLRAFRFKVLLQKELKIGTLFNIVAVHTMWTNLLPFRSGELSYFYLLKKKGGAASYVSGVPSLVLARLFDLVAISLLFLISFIAVETFPRELKIIGFVLFCLLLALLVFLIFLVSQRERFLGRLKFYILKFKLDKIKAVEKLLGRSEEILEGFKMVRSSKTLCLTALFSLLIWLFVYFFNYSLIRAVGVEVSILQVFFISSFFVLAGLFPIHGWAGFGTTEGIWVLMIIWFGLTKEMAIVTGFQLHLMALVFVVLLGVLGAILMSEFVCKLRRMA
ncbi:MAG: flippase-like domain-containing protein [Proteobacteria bacterium]|nr:flippase-like domain-containing protein [Pseudomonadota bacterium]